MAKSKKVQRAIKEIDEKNRWKGKCIVSEPIIDHKFHWRGKDFVIRANGVLWEPNKVSFYVWFDPRTEIRREYVAHFFISQDIYLLTPIPEDIFIQSAQFEQALRCESKCVVSPHTACAQ